MGPATLAQVLRPIREIFQAEDYPDLLVGLDIADDAAVYRISDDLALVHTLDFFTPIVDDPYDYGAIAAANAMSDVYAMGGRVVMALNISAFPPSLPVEVTREILRGGAEKVAEAGGVLAGGHTIDDNEPKYGLAVVGLVDPRRILRKGGALPGDRLLLTKPLGVGMVTTAAKGDVAEPEHVTEAVRSMARLNRESSELVHAVERPGDRPHAVTDITGFALLGHGHEMAEKSGVRLRFFLSQLPFVAGAQNPAEQWLFPAGSCTNQTHYQPMVRFAPGITEEQQMLLFTPETSGGLLVSASPDEAERLLARFEAAGHPCWEVGDVVEGEGVEVLP
jgi:selenide, water dikinase